MKKSMIHYDFETKKYGKYVLVSPEFDEIEELIKWKRENEK